MSRWRASAMFLLLTFALGLSNVDAQAPAPAMDQAEVESRLERLAEEIDGLQNLLARSREEHQQEQQQLREIDLAIQATSLRLRELESEKAGHLLKLSELEKQRDQQLAALRERQDQLELQIVATYQLAKQSRTKLILNQDDPSQLSRMLAYYDHINRAQASRIRMVKELLAGLEETRRLIDEQVREVELLQSAQADALATLQAQRGSRLELLTALAAKISSEESALKELESNRQDLETLLEKLTDVLADIPADLGQHLGVAAQKGQLPLPVNGRVAHAFGQSRAAGLRWQGWLIEAASGAEVRNVAYGRVAFADWLRGYGLLIIIDHGQGFMSLYGYNETLLWEVGDWVEPGAVIAVVGGNAAAEQGLYFEMRKDGKAVDPAAWIKR